MALFIAKSPQYRSRGNVPSEIGIRFSDLRPSRAENEAIDRLGNLLVIRADEMKKERDAAVVGDLYNRFRESERSALLEISKKKGKDAVNLDQDYDRFFNKSLGAADQEAENGYQQSEINRMLGQHKQQSLDSIAKYEAKELQNYKAEQEVGVINNAVSDARIEPFNELKFENTRIETFDYIARANPGMSEEALRAKLKAVESQIVFANMQARISVDAERGAEDVEKWKEVLGDDYLSLKDDAKTKSKTQAIDRVQGELQTKYESNGVADFGKMRNELSQSNLPQDVKFEVRQWIDAYEVQTNNLKSTTENKLHDAEEREIGMAFFDGRYADVKDLIRKSQYLKGDEIATWTGRLVEAKNRTEPVDRVRRAISTVQINQMISQGLPENEVWSEIVANPYLTQDDQKQFINKLQTKLTGEIESGRKEGYGLIVDMIFPKVAGPARRLSQLAQSPEQTTAIAEGQNDLDEWINLQLQQKRYPNVSEIRLKALEIGKSKQTPMIRLILEQQQKYLRNIEGNQ